MTTSTDGVVTLFGATSRVAGAATLVSIWVLTAVGSPFLGVPMLACGAILAVPGLASCWMLAAMLPADYALPIGRRAGGAGAMGVASLLTFGALFVGLGETSWAVLNALRGHPFVPPLALLGVALAVVSSGVAYAVGFQLRWGLHPVLALAAGAACAVVPASCLVMVVFGFLGLPLSA